MQNTKDNSFTVVSAAESGHLPRNRSERLQFRVPTHWQSPIPRNPCATEAEQQVLAWFENLGCTPAELAHARQFDVAGYVGIPFPSVSLDAAVRIGKYLSMWLLWDDLQVECLESHWKIHADHVMSDCPPSDMTRFDKGWWQLYRELSARRSPQWISKLCATMSAWNEVAVEEAMAMRRYRDTGALPTFAAQLEMRVVTIGMDSATFLLGDAYGFELPQDFHDHPTVLQLNRLASQIVVLGNDILGFGKDVVENQPNLVSILMRESDMGCDDALEHLIRMHNESVVEFDRLAASLDNWRGESPPFIDRWLQDVRYVSTGLTIWESQAPRYTSHKIVCNGMVIEPTFSF